MRKKWKRLIQPWESPYYRDIRKGDYKIDPYVPFYTTFADYVIAKISRPVWLLHYMVRLEFLTTNRRLNNHPRYDPDLYPIDRWGDASKYAGKVTANCFYCDWPRMKKTKPYSGLSYGALYRDIKRLIDADILEQVVSGKSESTPGRKERSVYRFTNKWQEEFWSQFTNP